MNESQFLLKKSSVHIEPMVDGEGSFFLRLKSLSLYELYTVRSFIYEFFDICYNFSFNVPMKLIIARVKYILRSKNFAVKETIDIQNHLDMMNGVANNGQGQNKMKGYDKQKFNDVIQNRIHFVPKG